MLSNIHILLSFGSFQKSLHYTIQRYRYLNPRGKLIEVEVKVKIKLSLPLTNKALRHEGVWGSGFDV
jgi:hypothetical protein